MNYITEIRAFYDWLELNQIDATHISLWHGLMHIANKTGWQSEFTIPMSTLELKTGLKRGAIYNARNKLQQLGLITFSERKGNQCSSYTINSLCLFNEHKDDTITTETRQKCDTTTTQTENINKQNETKQDISLDGENAAERKAAPNPNEVVINADEMFEKAYEFYPNKKGKAEGKGLYLGYLHGREIKGYGKVKYNHAQLYIAIRVFAEEMENEMTSNNRERAMIKHFDTFMNKPVVEYVESSTEQYREAMQKKYGDGWEKLKFEYTFKGQKKSTVKENEAV